MFHDANSLQELFDYNPMYCYSIYVQSTVSDNLTNWRSLLSTDCAFHTHNLCVHTTFHTHNLCDTSMVIMHEAVRKIQNFPYKLFPEAKQKIKKIMQAASTGSDQISMDASIDDPF